MCDLFLHHRPEDSISSLGVALFDTWMPLMDLAESAGSEPRRDDDSVYFQQNGFFNCNLHTVDPVKLHFFADLVPAVWPTLPHIFHDFYADWVFGCLSSDFISITDWSRHNIDQFIDHDDVCVFLSPLWKYWRHSGQNICRTVHLSFEVYNLEWPEYQRMIDELGDSWRDVIHLVLIDSHQWLLISF